jgi:hypothetical protein
MCTCTNIHTTHAYNLHTTHTHGDIGAYTHCVIHKHTYMYTPTAQVHAHTCMHIVFKSMLRYMCRYTHIAHMYNIFIHIHVYTLHSIYICMHAHTLDTMGTYGHIYPYTYIHTHVPYTMHIPHTQCKGIYTVHKSEHTEHHTVPTHVHTPHVQCYIYVHTSTSIYFYTLTSFPHQPFYLIRLFYPVGLPAAG